MAYATVRGGALAVAITCASNPALADAARGEKYFSDLNGGGCYSCHFTDQRKMVGPGLQGVGERHSQAWLRQFLADPQATWESDHAETLELKQRLNKKRAPRTLCRKGEMSDQQLTDLIDYLNSLR